MARGFYWTANSAFIQGMWLRLRRAPRAAALSTTIADGFIPTLTPMGTTHYNANPAYLIFECVTNTDWGMGGSPNEIDIDSFQYAAQIYRNENAGLFMTWSQQSTIEDFVGDVLDHVQSLVFLNPTTGLLNLKPLRADYNVDDLSLFNPDNCNVEDYDRKTWGETINEIVVSWTNPATEKAETVSIQDLANIVQQGGQIISQTRNYYGFRSRDVALDAAARDLRTACAPLRTCALIATRAAFSLTPGECLRLHWPEEDDDEVVMRVQTIDYGNTTNGTIRATLIEDIFALDSTVYVGGQDSGWVDPSAVPTNPSNVLLTTAPAFIVANSAEQFVEQPIEPEVNTLLLVSDYSTDFINYEPYTTMPLSTGGSINQSVGTGQRTPFATLPAALVPQIFSTVIGFENRSGRRPQLADFVFIGEVDTEIALIQAVASDGTYTLARGVLDTVPRAWPYGTPVWFVNNDALVLDTTLRAPGETVTYRLLMRTSVGLLLYEDALERTTVLDSRPYRPLRPANVQVNGTGFGIVALAGGNAVVTWSNRNRLLETGQVLNWGAGTVTPESGQTTRVQVLGGGTVTHDYGGLTGTTLTISAADLSGGSVIRVLSERGGYQSLQHFDMAYTS